MHGIYRNLLKLEAIFAATFLVLMVLLIFLGGVARMAGNPLNWTIDLSTCFFAWGCFLCADIAWRRDGLMAIDLIPSRLPEATRRLLQIVNHVLIAGFLVYVVYAGAWLSWISRARSFQGIPGVSYSWVTMSIVVGGLLLLVTTLIRLARMVRREPAAATD